MMNRLKNIFGASVIISNRVQLRGTPITRSAGTNGSDPKRSKDILVTTDDGETSGELKLSGRSYAKIIADYGREIEARNAATKVNGDAATGNAKGGFFSTTPFHHLTRISSLVKIKNGRENNGPSLSTKSYARLPDNSSKTNDTSTIHRNSHEITVDLNRMTERAEWLDNVIKTPEAKNVAHPLVQRITKSKSTGNTSSSESLNVGNHKISAIKKIPKTSGADTKNVSVEVKPLKKTDKNKNELPTMTSDDNDTMLITVTEESKSSSTSRSSPLRHIDLRINGKPAAGVDTMISKVEKLNFVSSAEKIEIRIPVLSDANDKLQVSDSTINVYISSQAKRDGRESLGKINKSGDSAPGNSRSGFAQPSTFFTSKIQNVRKTNLSTDHSKVVPWWTTMESFRRSEIVVASSEKIPFSKNLEMKAFGIGETATRGNQESKAVEAKEVALSDDEMRVKPVVTKPSSPRQWTDGRRKDTLAISKIIMNELHEKQKSRVSSLGVSKSDAKLEAGPDTKVKRTASNEPKKEVSSMAVGSTMPGKSIQPGTPTPDEFSKKIRTSLGSTVAASGGESKTEFKSSKRKDTSTNNNLSSANDSEGRIQAKPISEIENTNADTQGRTISTGQVSKHMESIKVRSGAKPQRDISSNSETNEVSELPRSYGKVKHLPSKQSSAKPVELTKNGRRVSVKQNSDSPGTVENPTITMKPIEKKKDGTLIDYGATVTTRKKLERKLSVARSSNEVQRKKIVKEEKPVVVIATIKKVIPKRNSDISTANNSNIDDSTTKLNGSNKNKRMSETRDHCRAQQKKWHKTPSKRTINVVNESRTPGTPVNTEKRNSKGSPESQVIETVRPDKKLLYSVWLRRFKERNGEDPDPTKDPTSRKS